jgi:hypothetical protein
MNEDTLNMHEIGSTLTNIAFVLAGFLIYKRSRYVGLSTILLGIASAGWHWTLQPFWHTFDLVMMYFVLLGLINYSEGSDYTKAAFLAGVGMIGIHFLLPSHMIILTFALLLLLSLLRHYSSGKILIIVACFALWITTNIPYLHEWNVPFWKLDISHGFSHAFAALGIFMTVSYKPAGELSSAPLAPARLAWARELIQRKYRQIMDVPLHPLPHKQSGFRQTSADIYAALKTSCGSHFLTTESLNMHQDIAAIISSLKDSTDILPMAVIDSPSAAVRG